MSSPQRPEKDQNEGGAESERTVVRYLREHPDFFAHHLDLLAGMTLPHREGQAVSLIEKQVSVLRDQKDELRNKLNFIIRNAEHNDDLRNRIDDLILHLLDARTLDDVFDILQHRLKHDFEADHVVVKLFNSNHPAMASHPEALHWQEPELTAFEKILKGRKPACGQFKAAQLDALFTAAAGKITSAALVPLVENETSTHSYGMLAIGSHDSERFRADMGTQFLAHLGKIVARIIKKPFRLNRMQAAELQWLDAFLDKLRHERRLSPHTQSNYQRDLQGLIGYMDDQAIAAWSDLHEAHIRSFIAKQHRSGLSGKSLQRRLSALRTFFNFLLIEKVVRANPAAGVRAPRTARKLPDTLDVDQTARLLEIQGDEPLTLRDRAIMELFYSSGLRLTELVNIDLATIDLNEALLDVTGKGNKTRRLPIGRYAVAALRVWLKVRGQLAASDEPALFVSQRGTRLSARNIQTRLRDWAIKQGIDVHVHPHMLRHSFASHMLESSSDLRAVQELPGHADISTTQIYTHLDFQHLAKVYGPGAPAREKKSG